MKPHAKTALALALAIVGGIAAGLRCDASEWVENSSQYAIGGAAYTVKTYTEGSGPFDAVDCVQYQNDNKGSWKTLQMEMEIDYGN